MLAGGERRACVVLGAALPLAGGREGVMKKTRRSRETVAKRSARRRSRSLVPVAALAEGGRRQAERRAERMETAA